MKWSICILTMPERRLFLNRLVGILCKQIVSSKAHGVELVVHYSDHDLSLGANRQAMIEDARGEYISQFDDDDLPSSDYVSSILPLLDGVDYIGFNVQTYLDTEKQKMTYHTLHCGGWSEDERGYYRDLSHINPIRKELALLASFDGGVGEDRRWAEALREMNAVQTEHYIDRVLYFYFARSDKSNQTPPDWTSTVAC